MRKRIIPAPQNQLSPTTSEDWLTLETLVDVEVTSEDADHPVESALLAQKGQGWMAAQPGQQTIRLVFRNPQRLRRIRLEFVESTIARTQEFVLYWFADGETSSREIVRQQWNFSPQGATVETEDYLVDLPNASIIGLSITPDISGGDACASLARLRLA